MRPSGADHPSAPPCAQDLKEVPSVRASEVIALSALAPPIAICVQNCRLSAYARGRVGCGSTAVENRPLESQEPPLRGNILRSAIPRIAHAFALRCFRIGFALRSLARRFRVGSLGPDRGHADVLPAAAPSACPPGHRRPPDASASRSARRPSTPWPSATSYAPAASIRFRPTPPRRKLPGVYISPGVQRLTPLLLFFWLWSNLLNINLLF